MELHSWALRVNTWMISKAGDGGMPVHNPFYNICPLDYDVEYYMP